MKNVWSATRRLPRAPQANGLTGVQLRRGSSIPPRSSAFAVPTKSHAAEIRSLLASSSSVLSTLDNSATEGDLVGYNDDWMNKYHGKSPIVVKPRNTEEVSKVVKYCYDNDIAVVPQAGNTGLVGKSSFRFSISKFTHGVSC
jgi:hypothetical protein